MERIKAIVWYCVCVWCELAAVACDVDTVTSSSLLTDLSQRYFNTQHSTLSTTQLHGPRGFTQPSSAVSASRQADVGGYFASEAHQTARHTVPPGMSHLKTVA